jgi:4-hydroxy-3-methylbut-2-en-1-yl diphosphate synthase IspG/GcpE
MTRPPTWREDKVRGEDLVQKCVTGLKVRINGVVVDGNGEIASNDLG